jgi:putative ABC transport system substrate-binding protein
MRRRDVLVGGAAALLWPSLAPAQPEKVPAIGVLVIDSPAAEAFRRGFKEALRGLGYTEGRDVRFEFRTGQGNARLQELAADLVRNKVDVIVTWFTPTAFAARKATSDIPIVMGAAGNPVETGLVASLAHPGGNITGIAGVGAERAGKLVELFREALPSSRRVAALANAPDPFSKPFLAAIEASGKAIGMTIDPVPIEGVAGLDAAFATMAKDPPDALIVQPSLGMERPAKLALEHRIPAASIFPAFAESGGLISYAADYNDVYKTVAIYVTKILKGARPAELPVERPDKFILTVNLKTAAELGLSLPRSFLARANEVIE